MKLPKQYHSLTPSERRQVRLKYIELQGGNCYWCKAPLDEEPDYSQCLDGTDINWDLFPNGFRDHPVHLQHCHETGWTEGAVHMFCNAYMWQYEGR